MKIQRTFTLAIGLAAIAAATAFAQTASAQGNKSTGSTLIKDSENPGRGATQGACSIEWLNLAGNSQCQLMQVPAGKRLVIEHTSGICRTQGSNLIRNAQIETSLSAGNSSLIWTYLILTGGATTVDGHYSAVTQPMRAYADPESTVNAVAWLEGVAGAGNTCHFVVSGHLVDAQ